MTDREEEPIAGGADWMTGAAERDPDWALATDASIRNAAAMARLNLKFIWVTLSKVRSQKIETVVRYKSVPFEGRRDSSQKFG